MRFWTKEQNLDVREFLYLVGVKITATALSLNAAIGNSDTIVLAGSMLKLTRRQHANKLINLDQVTGSAVELPAATGSGVKFRFYIAVRPTSNDHRIVVANSSDTMQGIAFTRADTASNMEAFATVATSDSIVMNGTTTGAAGPGAWAEVEDVAPNLWQVEVFTTSTGASATPFQAIV